MNSKYEQYTSEKRQKWILESKFDFRKLRKIKQAENFFKDQTLCTRDTRPEVFH